MPDEENSSPAFSFQQISFRHDVFLRRLRFYKLILPKVPNVPDGNFSNDLKVQRRKRDTPFRSIKSTDISGNVSSNVGHL